MQFTKMQGLGNDYVYVDASRERVDDPAGLARRIADRHYGVGGDGLILIHPSRDADVRMQMFNADGSEAEMCGNGVRCVAKYAWDHGLSRANPMRVQTGAGVKTIELTIENDRALDARVDMGEPILRAADVPVAAETEQVIDEPIVIAGQTFNMTCVSMGNPHAVMFVDNVEAVDLAQLGPLVETHEAFPQRINAHWVQVESRNELTMVTWERGSGVTLACGTGASAVCVAGVLTGRCDRDVKIHLPGGPLRLQWARADNHVYMTGPAVEVFAGTWPDGARQEADV